MKKGDIIFLSASVPYREEWTEGSKPAEIEEAIISVARAVFARGGRLLFGGHPSVSPLVSAVAGEYFPADPSRQFRPVVTFQSRLFEKILPDETTEMVRLGWSAIEWTDVGKGESEAETREHSLLRLRESMLPTNFEAKEMAVKRNDLRPPVAMIAVGGMDGVRDEALIFLQNRQKWGSRPRIYAFRSGGGAAARLLQPSEKGLWPGKEQPDSRKFEGLRSALQEAHIVDIEAAWHRNFSVPADAPFQPYAAMAQWLLDTQLELVR